MVRPCRIAFTMLAVGNLSGIAVYQILHSPFIDFFSFCQISFLRFIMRTGKITVLITPAFRIRISHTIGRNVIVKGQCSYHCREIDTSHLTITGSIFIRIADRLPLPEHTSTQILFRICIRTRITYAGRTVPYTCKTCFCQTAILFHFK